MYGDKRILLGRDKNSFTCKFNETEMYFVKNVLFSRTVFLNQYGINNCEKNSLT